MFHFHELHTNSQVTKIVYLIFLETETFTQNQNQTAQAVPEIIPSTYCPSYIENSQALRKAEPWLET